MGNKTFWDEPMQQEELSLGGPAKPQTTPLAAKTGGSAGTGNPAAPNRPENPRAPLGGAQRALTDREKYSAEYCLNVLATDQGIWDMRAWKAHKDIAEVMAWVLMVQPDHKNCGHAGFCITLAKAHGVPVNEIVAAIMANPHVMYRQRLAACMAGEECPQAFNEDGKEVACGYRTCWRCEGLQKDPYTLETSTCPTCGTIKTTRGDGATFYHHPDPPKKEKSPRVRGGKIITKEDSHGENTAPGTDGEGGSAQGNDAEQREQPVVEPAGGPEVHEPDGPGGPGPSAG